MPEFDGPPEEEDDVLDITMGREISRPEPQPWPADEPITPFSVDDKRPLPLPGPPEGDLPLRLPVYRLPWSDQPIRAEDILGHFDCWIGEVQDTHYDTADGLLGLKQVIDVVRVGVAWGTNNEPTTHEMPQAGCNPTPATTTAVPWPLRHDQELYHVSVGDAVAIITGRDGVNYFFVDDLPFPAVVIKNTASTNEDQAGGAGLLDLKVRRKAMSGDPTSAVATLADMLTAAGAEVEISYVKPLGPDNMHHGYRTGDIIHIQKRGRYYYALPTADKFAAVLVDAGPDSEADFTDGGWYWALEYDRTVAYTNNDWTSTQARRRATEMSGNKGRWVKALNSAEVASDTHHLPTVTAPATGVAIPSGATYVTIHMHADPATGEVWYFFDHALPGILWAKAYANWTNSAGNGSYVACHPCDDKDGANENVAITFNVYLPRTAEQDPNVRDDEVIAYTFDGAGVRVCITGYLDDKIGTVKWWTGATADIPLGWALCDGANGTKDLSGRFIMCLDADGQADENAVDGAGGFRAHGGDENDHDDHNLGTALGSHDIGAALADHDVGAALDDHTEAEVAAALADHPAHSHDLSYQALMGAGAGVALDKVVTEDFGPQAHSGTGNSDDDLAHSGTAGHSGSVSHSGTVSHSETDNRPRYFVLAAIQRIN